MLENEKIKDNPVNDVLTPVGDLSWKDKKEEDSINAEDMFENTPIPGTSGVEC
ncbi:MAG: hypothetical protein K9M56_07060 [Victivallales bacterium]|nr:hypothetical protein [Victivallales bacterium]